MLPHSQISGFSVNVSQMLMHRLSVGFYLSNFMFYSFTPQNADESGELPLSV